MRSEASYQAKLIDTIKQLLPGCFIIINDPAINQGIPDLLILFETQWAMLEVKVSERSRVQPNQPYYVDMFNEMSFASFIYPEIEEEVLHELQQSFGVGW